MHCNTKASPAGLKLPFLGRFSRGIQISLRSAPAVSLLAAVIAPFAFAASASAADEAKTLAVAAESFGIAYPRLVTFPVANDQGPFWQPGDPIREIPRQHWDDPALFKPVPRPVNAPQPDWLVQLQRVTTSSPAARPVSSPPLP